MHHAVWVDKAAAHALIAHLDQVAQVAHLAQAGGAAGSAAQREQSENVCCASVYQSVQINLLGWGEGYSWRP